MGNSPTTEQSTAYWWQPIWAFVADLFLLGSGCVNIVIGTLRAWQDGQPSATAFLTAGLVL